MSIILKEKGIYGTEVQIISQGDNFVVYKMQSDSGEGIITGYKVFPGIELLYNDIHMGNCFHNKLLVDDVMEINHCRHGRFECDFQNGLSVYLEKGDISAHVLSSKTTNSCFPLEYYYGVSVLINLAEASRSISSVLEDISIDIYALRDKLCPKDKCFIMRTKDSVEHIFSELYTVPDEIKHGYLKLKVLELLLFLSVSGVDDCQGERQYFHRNQVEIVKSIKEYMTHNLEHHYTLNELSARFGISLTSMKTCFRDAYGMPIFTFMRIYRMQAAAMLLRQSKDSVIDIAGKVGYENSSKFASAFKEVIGLSPLEYRKTNNPNGAFRLIGVECRH